MEGKIGFLYTFWSLGLVRSFPKSQLEELEITRLDSVEDS